MLFKSDLNLHPMAVNTNTRLRWEAIQHWEPMQNLAGKKVLDVGAGLGFFSRAMQLRGADVLAIDLDQPSLGFLQENFGIPGRRLDVEREPFPSGPFSLVFLGEVLEHVVHPLELIKKAAVILEPGGNLILTTPALEGPLTDSFGKRLGHQDGTERHHRDGFSSQEIHALLASTGLKRVRHEYGIFLMAELFMQITKAVFLLKGKRYHGQSDVLRQSRSLPYRFLGLVFPILLCLFRAEERVSCRKGKVGHAHLVWAVKT